METHQQEGQSYMKILSIDDFFPECQENIEDYICPLCKGITFNPVVDCCGHIYCRNCFNLYISHNNICPVTKEILESEIPSEMLVVAKILNKQRVYCPNRRKNCSWGGLLSDYVNHLTVKCPKHIVSCSHMGCSEKIIREGLEGHKRVCMFRREKCAHCFLDMPFLQVASHLNKCPKIEVQCPQNCSQTVIREHLQVHIKKDCLQTKVSCPYSEYGCEAMMIKRELNDHINGSLHYHTTILHSYINKVRNNIRQSQDALDHKLKETEEYFVNYFNETN